MDGVGVRGHRVDVKGMDGIMADGGAPDPARIKIVPRNLTARADYVVRGNPAASRPESGVDNCYPGLEFDQRNLEQRFFPGLTFEFQRMDGAIVVGMNLDDRQRACGLAEFDSSPTRSLFLWFLYGRTAEDQPEPALFSFRGHKGVDVWRRVHDLLPGRVAILLGPAPGFDHALDPTVALEVLANAYDASEPCEVARGTRLEGTVPAPWKLGGQHLDITVDSARPVRVSFTGRGPLSLAAVIRQINRRVPRLAAEAAPGSGTLALTSSSTGPPSRLRVRGPAARVLGLPRERVGGHIAPGPLLYAVLSGDRARYLGADGVIDVAAYPPGELTKTMCAPWIYDFRDCYCFFWASSKPDVVADATDRVRYVNFLRRDRSEPPPLDRATSAADRSETELTVDDLMEGWWHKLPVVLDDREASALRVDQARGSDFLNRDEAITELTYLATVEHALVVEYLYALYSVNAPAQRPAENAPALNKRTFSAADQLLRIAIDEMRHFLWANMILKLLGAGPSTGRASVIGARPTAGRKVYPAKKYLEREFRLAPLTRETLNWFIEVERPSQAVGGDLDGMYVKLLQSVAEPSSRSFTRDEQDRIVPMLKLLIDEGQGHYLRFDGVAKTLKGVKEARYLRPLNRTPTPGQERLLKLCDDYYQTILEVIEVSFVLGAPAGDMLVREAVRSMDNLDDVARRLAAGGVGPRFTLPERPEPQTITPADAVAVFDARRRSFESTLAMSAATGDVAEIAHAARHRARSGNLCDKLTEIVSP